MSGMVDYTPQHQLSLVTGVGQEVARARLEKVVWAAPRDEAGNLVGAPGLHDLRGTARTALVNDLTRFQIRCRIRVVSAAALAEVLRGAGVPCDPDHPRVVVKGPTDASIVAGDIPWVDYELTPEWREYPAIFASWLDYARAEDRRLGAGYVAMRRVEEIAPGGEKVHRWQEYNVRPVDLFEFRLPGDEAGARAPLALPGRASQDAREIAELRAMINELKALVAGTPPPAPAPEEGPRPVVVAPGERVRDEAPARGDTFTMPGGAYVGRDAYGDDTRTGDQVGFSAEEFYQANVDGGSATELAAVVQNTGGGTVKTRRR